MSNYAILDIGTNSIKFFAFSIENGKAKTLVDTNNIARLGEGLSQTGKISNTAMQRNITALREFQQKARELNVEEITAVGTMCLRTAQNSSEFIQKVKNELDLDIEVIKGEEEARLSYLAVLSTIGKTNKDLCVFDTGGGSTEFIFGEGTELKNRISLNLGAVHPTEKFLLSDPVTKQEQEKMMAYIKDFFQPHLNSRRPEILIGIGGTVTSMGAVKHKMVKYDPQIIQGTKITADEVDELMELFRNKTIEQRKQIPGLQPKRADVILAGAAIVKTIMDIFRINSFTISDRGLRHGLMFDLYLK
ncbi:MAG TPA: Ppx/GppA family phosphatase [Candidatus Cloacimonas sp.]|jgi:exopolyphosphatase/guanosine-5'-triphosphate,3'-diphosphate pyrophosphatase|nr:exopolyphosphatase / guanosine-5-triphosphate,3-diphosphate pyrophosphatase [Candidatus Cloacimonadota bacterium]HCX73474.1 Ppx/GppA family phosphatase [Candidatus Cloacimonas sp.]